MSILTVKRKSMIFLKVFYYIPLIFSVINLQASPSERCQKSLSSHKDSYIDIDILHLPLHIQRTLLFGGIYSVEALVTRTEEELLSLPMPGPDKKRLTDQEQEAIKDMTPEERDKFLLVFRDNLEWRCCT